MASETLYDSAQVIIDPTLSPRDLQGFYDGMKGIIWVLRIISNFNGDQLATFGTGFSVDSNGLIMTVSHIFQKKGIFLIHARRLDENKFSFEAEIAYQKPKWDLALLQVKGVSNCSIGRLATDGSISVGQNLLHVGNPSNFVGSFLIGKSAFQCINDVVLPTSREICKDYQSTAMESTPSYRVMGHIWNSDYFRSHQSEPFSFEKSLHPLVPIIQIYGLASCEGCSGGPVFNINGEILGMVALGVDGFEIAIHVSLLSHFLKEKEENTQPENLKRDVVPGDKCGYKR